MHYIYVNQFQAGFKGFELSASELAAEGEFLWEDGTKYKLNHGAVVIAAITSCTNTSNYFPRK